MAALQFLPLYCTYFTITILTGNIEGSTPLCLLCPCNSKPNKPVNINCLRSGIDNIYNKNYWFTKSNSSYKIESLIYTYNNLTVLKTQFPSSTLKLLDLSRNSISQIGGSVFSELQKMESLYLGYNAIERIHPDVFRGVYKKDQYFPLKSLKTLHLNNNKLISLHADTFEHIDNLKVLILHNNPLKIIDAHTFSAIASLVLLEELDLSHTQISNMPDLFLHTLRHLRVLNLSGNNFTSIPKPLAQSRTLETLYFNKNPIRNLSGQSVFPRISTLKVLHMSQMPLLEALGAEALGRLQNLEELHLSNNKKLFHIHHNAFLRGELDTERLLPITKLFMQHNNLSYLQKLAAIQFDRLTNLDLRGNHWACNCRNWWLINDLVPLYTKINDIQQLGCASPLKVKGLGLFELHRMYNITRCSEWHSSITSEPDTYLLIGILSGVLIGVFLLMLFGCYYRSKKVPRKFSIATTSNNYYSRI